MQTPTVVSALTIAGSDSGGGAGIQADLKTFAAHGVHGLSAIAALTAQHTRGVTAVHVPDVGFLRAQLDACFDDFDIGAVKIGMLATADVIACVADALETHRPAHVVLDPVMVATSGAVLIEKSAMETLVRELFPRATVITPNLDEAALLVNRPLHSPQDMEQAALDLLEQGARAVLLKGGHLPGETVIDLLITESGERHWMEAPRIHSPNTHGTGCTLSSAIASYLALGASLAEAVVRARAFVRGALLAGALVTTGHGSGPLNHGHSPMAMRVNVAACRH